MTNCVMKKVGLAMHLAYRLRHPFPTSEHLDLMPGSGRNSYGPGGSSEGSISWVLATQTGNLD